MPSLSRGQKRNEVSSEADPQLDRLRLEWLRRLEAPRGGSSASQPIAVWDESVQLARVTRERGHDLPLLGLHQDGSQWLQPYEALCLLEEGLLSIRAADTERPLSVQEMSKIVLGDSPPLVDPTVYTVFCFLFRGGFICRHHSAPERNGGVSDGPPVPPLLDVFHRRTFSRSKLRDGQLSPLFIAAVYRSPDAMPTVEELFLLSQRCEPTPLQCACAWQHQVMFFDVERPGNGQAVHGPPLAVETQRGHDDDDGDGIVEEASAVVGTGGNGPSVPDAPAQSASAASPPASPPPPSPTHAPKLLPPASPPPLPPATSQGGMVIVGEDDEEDEAGCLLPSNSTEAAEPLRSIETSQSAVADAAAVPPPPPPPPPLPPPHSTNGATPRPAMSNTAPGARVHVHASLESTTADTMGATAVAAPATAAPMSKSQRRLQRLAREAASALSETLRSSSKPLRSDLEAAAASAARSAKSIELASVALQRPREQLPELARSLGELQDPSRAFGRNGLLWSQDGF